MMNIERVLGTLEEQGRWVQSKFLDVEKNIESMEKKIDELMIFRWKIYGMSVVIAAVSTVAFEIIVSLMRPS